MRTSWPLGRHVAPFYSGIYMPGFVKIRSGLIGRMDRDPMSAARVDVLNRRCHSMGIRTIAEHVERPETLEILRQAGVDFAQGFLVGCPEPID